ncbi:MAG: site-specific integrase [Bacteroidota bacterium]
MASVKIVLRKKQNKDGTFPLAIRITKDRKTSFIHLGYHLKVTDWDGKKVKKSHPNSTRLNNFLLKKIAEVNDKSLEMESQKNDVSSKAIKNNVKPSVGSSFFDQAESFIDNLKKSGKYNRVVSEEPRINRFREFLKGADISFQEITVPLLNRFRAYLKSTRQISERTIINHLIVIRTVFNQAIKANIVDTKYYPFGKEKVQIKFPESLKIGLNSEEVKCLEELELEDSFLNHARNVWLFSFYFAGMRVSDVLRLKWTDFQNERLHYAMGKNAKVGSLKIPEKGLKILSQYKSQKKNKNDLVFPELKILDDLNDRFEVERKISYAVKRLDKALHEIAEIAEIEKSLTMHIARHTFGNISGERIPLQMLQKLYRHSSITTTIGYQANFIHKDADDALDAVISFKWFLKIPFVLLNFISQNQYPKPRLFFLSPAIFLRDGKASETID